MNEAEAIRQTTEGASAIPYIVLAAYLVMLLVLGIVAYARSRVGEEDYYLAGRNQGWLVSSLTIMATFFSSFALLGAPGMVYKQGVIFALFSLNVPLAGACVYIIGVRIWRVGRKFGYVTPGDMVGDYYNSHALRILVAVAGILYVIPYVVIQIQAGGLVSQTLVPGKHSFEIGAILLALITTLYIMVGGMRSVAWTDVVQGLMLVGGMFLGGYVAVKTLGGLGEFSRKVMELDPKFLTAPGAAGGFPVTKLLTVCVLASTASMITPAQWMRYLSARDAKTLRRAALVFAVVLAACFLFGTMLVGLGGKLLYPDLETADQVLVKVIYERVPELFPIIGVALASTIVVAIMAASMSTADSNLHALSAVLTRDVYDRYLHPKASQRERLWVGRLIILAATVAALTLVVIAHLAEEAAAARGDDHPASVAIQSLNMIADIAFLAMAFSLQVLPVVVDMLWIRRGSSFGASLGMLGGLVTVALFNVNKTFPGNLGFVDGWIQSLSTTVPVFEGTWGLAVNVLLFVGISCVTSPPANQRTEAFRAALEK